jgi:hypothetical protein
MSSDEERSQDNIQSEETEGTGETRTPVQRVSEAIRARFGRTVRQGTDQEETNLQRNLFQQNPEEQQEPADESLPERLQEDSTSREERQQEIMASQPTTMSNMPTVHANASDMFLDADPLEEEKLAGGACQHPRSERERLKNDPKSMDKIKKGCTYSLDLKFGLPTYMVSSKYNKEEEDDENGNGAATDDATDTIIGVGYRCRGAKLRCQEYDLLNALQVPTLTNATGGKPSLRWDFNSKRFLFDEFGLITKEEILQWSEDCLLWAKDELDRQDQDWLLCLARNSCTTDLKVLIDRAFDKLPAKHQAGCVYWWMMLDAMVKITDDIANGLKNKIKTFAEKGLLSYKGENVETARIEMTSICFRLSERNMLPKDSVTDIIKGLSKCSHEEFSKFFIDLHSATKNNLMGQTRLTGDTITQIELVFDEAENHYIAFALNSEWNAAPSAHFAKPGMGPCDNCDGDHFARECKKPIDKAKVSRKQKERADARRNRGGGGGRGGGRGGNRGNQGGRGGGGGTNKNGYSRGKWGPPKDSTEITRKVNGKVYCACRVCGWNEDHTSGGHDEATENPQGYVMSKTLKNAIARTKSSSRNRGEKDEKEEKSGAGADKSSEGAAFSTMLKSVEAYEKDAEDPQDSAFAGQFGKFLRGYLKE